MSSFFPVLRQISSDRFIWLLLCAVALAVLAPLGEEFSTLGSVISSAGVFLIFLLHGIRLERAEVVAGFRNIRLQGAIFGFVFGLMLVAGFTLSKLTDNFLPHDLALGFLFIGVLPSTVQSATSYCAIAQGNVAASIVASAFTNLCGVVISPLMFALLASAAGGSITTEGFVRIFAILLLPFVIGQLVQRWTRPWIMTHKGPIAWADKIVIAIVIYIAFSGAVLAGTWFQVSAGQLALMASGLAVFLAFGFGGAWTLGGWLGLVRNDRKTLLFSGAQKSIAIGAPMAAIIFPPDRAGMILLPLLLYHLTQLVISAPVALHLAKKSS
ncbi:bile acid:sodium symporter [Parasphingorhabdus sp. JC815]|uniref:bile acid:sodium symporter n=1 Tax=Parasphingorhabdus sp. JC815 TaxID=3232140 RepID=UPI003457F3D3